MQILCIQLQRVTPNGYGDLLKIKVNFKCIDIHIIVCICFLKFSEEEIKLTLLTGSYFISSGVGPDSFYYK